MYLVVGPFTLTDTSINSEAKRQTAKLPAKARRPDIDYRPRHYKRASAHIGPSKSNKFNATCTNKGIARRAPTWKKSLQDKTLSDRVQLCNFAEETDSMTNSIHKPDKAY